MQIQQQNLTKGVPLNDFVLIEVDIPEEKGPVIVPDSARKQMQSNMGTVVGTGEGRRTLTGSLIKPAVKIGDRVLFHPGGMIPCTIDGKLHAICQDTKLLLKFVAEDDVPPAHEWPVEEYEEEDSPLSGPNP